MPVMKIPGIPHLINLHLNYLIKINLDYRFSIHLSLPFTPFHLLILILLCMWAQIFQIIFNASISNQRRLIKIMPGYHCRWNLFSFVLIRTILNFYIIA